MTRTFCDACGQEILKLIEAPQPANPVVVPTVESLWDEIDAIAYDYLSTVEQSNFMYRVKELLTARLKGADHE